MLPLLIKNGRKIAQGSISTLQENVYNYWVSRPRWTPQESFLLFKGDTMTYLVYHSISNFSLTFVVFIDTILHSHFNNSYLWKRHRKHQECSQGYWNNFQSTIMKFIYSSYGMRKFVKRTQRIRNTHHKLFGRLWCFNYILMYSESSRSG